MKHQKAIVISGASGVGKGTIVDHLTSPKKSNFRTTVSCTTRESRPEEVHGQHYYFLTRDEFEEKAVRGLFMEHKEVHGNLYGTLLSEFERLQDGGLIPVVEIDIKGALALTNIIPDACFIFLQPPSMKVLEERLRGRATDSEEEIQRRLSIAKEEQLLASSPPFIHVTNAECVFQTTSEIVNYWRASS
jgi:guanylate kinase